MESVILRSTYNQGRENEKLKAIVVGLMDELKHTKNELELCLEEGAFKQLSE